MKNSSTVKHRLVVESDLEVLSTIVASNDAKIVTLMRRDVTRWLEIPRKPEAYYAVECDGRVVGMGGYVPDVWGVRDLAWLVWFYFDPAHQRRGLGRSLYEKIESELVRAGIRKIYLDVGNEIDHRTAIAFHLSNGYRREGEMADFWKDGQDFLIFGKRLPTLHRQA